MDEAIPWSPQIAVWLEKRRSQSLGTVNYLPSSMVHVQNNIVEPLEDYNEQELSDEQELSEESTDVSFEEDEVLELQFSVGEEISQEVKYYENLFDELLSDCGKQMMKTFQKELGKGQKKTERQMTDMQRNELMEKLWLVRSYII